MFTTLGILLALAAVGCALSAMFAKEASNVKMGVFMGLLFLAGGIACIALNQVYGGSH